MHPQSIIHSMVEFADGSIKAQLGQPDMRLPISYALGLTERVSNDYPRLNFLEHTFTFEHPNRSSSQTLRWPIEPLGAWWYRSLRAQCRQ